jgi:hypothetical protein
LIFVLAGIFLIVRCTLEPQPLFTNSVITGSSWTHEYGIVTVTANGPYGQTITKTSSKDGEYGQYILTGLGSGTYSLDFMADGYGTVKQYGIQLFGNDTVKADEVILYKEYNNYVLPSFGNITYEMHGYSNINTMFIVLNTDMETSDSIIPIVFFMDVKNSVNNNNYSYVSFDYNVWKQDQSSKYYSIYFLPGILPFKSGTKVFFIGYVGNPLEFWLGYFDRYHGFPQYSTLIPEIHSEVMSFTVP